MTRPSDDDRSLLVRCRDGDTEAFRRLFGRKHRGVYLIAYQILGDAAAAEDVAQEVFLKLWERCADYDERFPVDAWLRRIVTNRAIDHWRSRKARRKRRVEAGAGVDPDAVLELRSSSRTGHGQPGNPSGPEGIAGWQRIQDVWDDLAATLPPQQRAAFVLRQIDGLSTADVAAALGCSASAVRSHVAEARATLRKGLRSRYPELARGR